MWFCLTSTWITDRQIRHSGSKETIQATWIQVSKTSFHSNKSRHHWRIRVSREFLTMFSRLSMSTALSTVNTFPTFDNYPICSMFQIRGTIPSSFERKIIELARKLAKISVSISKRKRKRRDNFWKFYKKKKIKRWLSALSRIDRAI